MSYIRLEIDDLEVTKAKFKESFLQQDRYIAEIKDRVIVNLSEQFKTRRVFAVDSGFNSAYEIRIHGATESCAFVRKLDFAPNQAAFDAAFSKKK